MIRPFSCGCALFCQLPTRLYKVYVKYNPFIMLRSFCRRGVLAAVPARRAAFCLRFCLSGNFARRFFAVCKPPAPAPFWFFSLFYRRACFLWNEPAFFRKKRTVIFSSRSSPSALASLHRPCRRVSLFCLAFCCFIRRLTNFVLLFSVSFFFFSRHSAFFLSSEPPVFPLLTASFSPVFERANVLFSLFCIPLSPYILLLVK